MFRSNLEWIEQTPLIVIELHDWQGGWRGTGHAVFSRLSTHPRDYMQRGDNMFSFPIVHRARIEPRLSRLPDANPRQRLQSVRRDRAQPYDGVKIVRSPGLVRITLLADRMHRRMSSCTGTGR